MAQAIFKALESIGLFRFVAGLGEKEKITAVCDTEHVSLLRALLDPSPVPVTDINDFNELPEQTNIVLDCRHPENGDNATTNVAKSVCHVPLFTDALACFISGAASLRPNGLPGRRYYLLSTPRSGSTFLCDLLTSTQKLGHPTEHLKRWMSEYLSLAGVSFSSIVDSLHRYSSSSNGVFGTKIIIDDLFCFLPEFADELFAELRRSAVFLLLRADKAEQALSNVRSNHVGVYHIYNNDAATEQLKALSQFKCDVDEVFAKERWLLRQEADLLHLLATHDIVPRILSYENCVQSLQCASAVVHDIALTVGCETVVSSIWPQLVRINDRLPSDDLDRYRLFRRGARLYSARSQPSLGDILGHGWNEPSHWGVSTSSETAVLRLAIDGIKVVELLINVDPGSATKLRVGNTVVNLPSMNEPSGIWRWIGLVEALKPVDGAIALQLDAGYLNLEEVVYYTDVPLWVEPKIGSGRVSLSRYS